MTLAADILPSAEQGGYPKEATDRDPLLPKKKESLLGADADFFALVFFSETVLIGLTSPMVVTAGGFMFMAYHLSGPQCSLYTAIIGLPYALQPCIGLLSDVVPICGYRKSPYIMLASVGGLIGFFTIGSSNTRSHLGQIPMRSDAYPSIPLNVFMICSVLITTMIVTVSVLMRSRLAIVFNDLHDSGQVEKSNNINYYFSFAGCLGFLLSSFVTGLMLSHLPASKVFLVAGAMACTVPLYTMLRGFGEPRISHEKIIAARMFFAEQWEAVFLSILLCVGTIITVIVSMLTQSNIAIKIVVSGIFFLVVMLSFGVLLNPTILRMCAFFFIRNAVSVQTKSADMYFYLDNTLEFPRGPHLTKFFVTFTVPLIGVVAYVVGIGIFRARATTTPVRKLLLIVILLTIPCEMFEIALVKRWNIAMGVSDELLALISTSFFTILRALAEMPFVFIATRLCPKGMESTVTSLILGADKVASTFGANVTAKLLSAWHISPKGIPFEQKQFDNLWKIIVFGRIVGYVVALCTLPLLPSMLVSDPILGEDDTLTSGSHLRRWMRKRGTKGTLSPLSESSDCERARQ
mmetsp:Transcript_21993/g.46779  ORF Transcript_21993/g.46779 Transcript_21993/m.46779 type:complete len:577 (+) Transcript_21993:63-1793(+)